METSRGVAATWIFRVGRARPRRYEIDYASPAAVPRDQLPLELPDTDDYAPGDDPAGCLARLRDWRFYQDDGLWRARETNTMPQWAGSCWYYLRYADSGNGDAFLSPENDDAWLPVDLYVRAPASVSLSGVPTIASRRLRGSATAPRVGRGGDAATATRLVHERVAAI